MASRTEGKRQGRIDLVNQLVEHFWPQNIHQASAWKVLQHTSSATLAPNYAILLLGVGNLHSDRRQLAEGVKQHAIAVNCLRRQVTSANDGLIVDASSMLVTIVYLLVCELIAGIPQDRNGWKDHVSGMSTIARAAFPLKVTTVEERFTYLRVRQLCLMSALWNRRVKDISEFDEVIDVILHQRKERNEQIEGAQKGFPNHLLRR